MKLRVNILWKVGMAQSSSSGKKNVCFIGIIVKIYVKKTKTDI